MCRIIGYTFNAAACCAGCTANAFETGELVRARPEKGCDRKPVRYDEHGLPDDLANTVGEPVRPMFSTDEYPDGYTCDECGEVIAAPAPLDAVPDSFDLETMLNGYQVCALWSSTDMADADSDRSLQGAGFTPYDFTADASRDMRNECEAFVRANWAHIVQVLDDSYGESDIGHDLWLSRNRHGAGFFDRVSGTHPAYPAFKALQDAARDMGEVHLCTTDDGKVEPF